MTIETVFSSNFILKSISKKISVVNSPEKYAYADFFWPNFYVKGFYCVVCCTVGFDGVKTDGFGGIATDGFGGVTTDGFDGVTTEGFGGVTTDGFGGVTTGETVRICGKLLSWFESVQFPELFDKDWVLYFDTVYCQDKVKRTLGPFFNTKFLFCLT